jgi:predicted extracellular nuclease
MLKQMRYRPIFLLVLIFLFGSRASAQRYKVGAIGFYNVENLFDTLDTPGVNDTEFSPAGGKHYGAAIYHDKLAKLAEMVSEVAADVTPDGLSILGVAEIENRSVLEDFVRHPEIADRNYQIVHYDSPDKRGIDVALLYQSKYFQVESSKPLHLNIFTLEGDTVFTRDILLVSGKYDGEPLHIMVNHWPSRSGGEAASRYRRNAAALRAKMAADSIFAEDPQAKILIMGDLNDDPISPSVADVIQAQGKVKRVKPGGFYNPWYDLFRKGLGTLAYRDTWSLFDQILVSQQLTEAEQPGYRYYQAVIHKKPKMLQKTGQYKGYPMRSFSGDTYIKGYSDHFPVYILLIKAI